MTWSPSFERHLHADDDRFLADIEMAEAADQAHAVELAGLFLEAADQQHVAIGGDSSCSLRELRDRIGAALACLRGAVLGVLAWLTASCGHGLLRGNSGLGERP